jgi:hypothetical protein
MRRFADQKELIIFATNFIKERIDSLVKDVLHCLQEPFAPFPALLYCFSTIDLLGALYAGNATKKAHTTDQSADYMQRFMNYTEEQTHLLQSLFRHKIIHLAQPKAVIEYDSRHISWRYWHKSQEYHLKMVKLQKDTKVQVTSTWEIPCDYELNISIWHLVKDIRESIEGPNGYFEFLQKTPDLQNHFEKAIEQIYDPTK